MQVMVLPSKSEHSTAALVIYSTAISYIKPTTVELL